MPCRLKTICRVGHRAAVIVRSYPCLETPFVPIVRCVSEESIFVMMLEWIGKLVGIIRRVEPFSGVKGIGAAERSAYIGDVVVVDLPKQADKPLERNSTGIC